MKQKYSNYYAYIFEGEDAPSAEQKGEDMKEKFPGSDFEVIQGTPCRVCSKVEGPDKKVALAIQDWIITPP